MVWEGLVVNVVSAYAPQVGLGGEEKEKFWEEFGVAMSEVKEGEKVVVGGDLNGHVWVERGWHGGWGYGSRNKEGEVILQEAMAQGLVVLNTWFEKEERHLVTYESGCGESQIDFFLTRAEDKRRCLVERVNWQVQGSVQEMWDTVAGEVMKCCREVLGVTKGGRNKVDKEVWWWEEAVQVAVRGKREAFRRWKQSGTEEARGEYKAAKKESKRAVACAKAKAYDGV